MATKVVNDTETLKKIGNTPLVKLNSLSSGKHVSYAKLESHNPFGSVTDRAVYWMIKGAEERFDNALKKTVHLSQAFYL